MVTLYSVFSKKRKATAFYLLSAFWGNKFRMFDINCRHDIVVIFSKLFPRVTLDTGCICHVIDKFISLTILRYAAQPEFLKEMSLEVKHGHDTVKIKCMINELQLNGCML